VVFILFGVPYRIYIAVFGVKSPPKNSLSHGAVLFGFDLLRWEVVALKKKWNKITSVTTTTTTTTTRT
jgi:hypothetical protein